MPPPPPVPTHILVSLFPVHPAFPATLLNVLVLLPQVMQELPESLGNTLCQLMWEKGEPAPKPEPRQQKPDAKPQKPDPKPDPKPKDKGSGGGKASEEKASKSKSHEADGRSDRAGQGAGAPVRYFVIKAPNENIKISQDKGLWATHKRGQQQLIGARQQSKVVLCFPHPLEPQSSIEQSGI